MVFVGLTTEWRSLLTEIPAEGSTPSSSTNLLISPQTVPAAYVECPRV
jgi:hypothetical protein